MKRIFSNRYSFFDIFVTFISGMIWAKELYWQSVVFSITGIVIGCILTVLTGSYDEH